MKKQIFILIVFFFTLEGYAQQNNYNHAYYSPLIYNPALAGDQGEIKIIALSSRQWVGSENAVSSTMITGGLPLAKHLAIGARLSSDKVGLINNTAASMILAYHLRLSAESNLSFGLSTGAAKTALGTSDLNAADGDDQLLGSIGLNETGFQGGFGLSYRNKRLDLGISSPSLISKKSTVSRFLLKNGKQFILSGGYKFPVGQVLLAPRAIFRTQNEFQGKLETMMTFYLKESFWLGGLYRFSYGPAFYGGFNIGKSFKVGYAYALGPGSATAVVNGTHEIFLSYDLKSVFEKP